MAGLTNYGEDKIIGHLFNAVTYTPPATWYVGLFTNAPADTGGGVEVSGGAYARLPISPLTTTSGGVAEVTNTNTITWAAASTPWGTITHAGLFDAVSAGNLFAFAELQDVAFTSPNPKTINTSDVFVIEAGNLKFALD